MTKWWTDFPVGLLYYVLAVTAASTAVLCASGLQTTGAGPPGPLMDVTYWLDPLLFNLLTLALTSVVITEKICESLGTPRRSAAFWKGLFTVAVICSFCVLLSYILEVFVLKPAFSHHRPPMAAGETFLLRWLGYDPSRYRTSTPSGFTFRQTLLVLVCLLCSFRRTETGTWRLRWRAFVVSLVGMFLTAIVAFVRVYRGLHTPLDIGIGIACGFFFFTALWYFIFFFGNRHRQLTRAVLAASLVFGPVFFFYSGSAAQWTIIMLVMLVALAIPELLPAPRRRGGHAQ